MCISFEGGWVESLIAEDVAPKELDIKERHQISARRNLEAAQPLRQLSQRLFQAVMGG